MKKRILSFLVACVMVVSTFIISKPLVNVYAVDNETTFVEDENQWTLPYNWNGYNNGNYGVLDTYTDSSNVVWDIASQGNGLWKLTSFAPSTGKLSWTGTTGASWIESYRNRVTNKGAGAMDGEGWYVSTAGRWTGGTPFNKGDNTSYMRVSLINSDSNVTEYGRNPAIVFTAPEDGVYSYTELVAFNNYLDESNPQKEVVVEVSVWKNRVKLDTVTLDKDDATSVTLNGTVPLVAGDELMLLYSLSNNDEVTLTTASSAEKPAKYILNVSDVVVKKVSSDAVVGMKWDLPTDFYTCNPGVGEKINGNWQLASYDTTTQKTYYQFGASGSSHHASNWYFDCKDPIGGQYGSFTYYANGIKVNPGSDAYPYVAAAILFTAPDDGVYEFDADTFTYGTNKDKTGSRTNIFYVMKDGVIYDITNPKYNADNTENMTGTITLKKGEKIYFCVQRYTKYTKAAASADWPDWIGARFEGLSVEKVAELTEGYDFVTKYTFAPDGSSLADGQFEMKAYDFTTKTVSNATLTAGEDWYVSATSGNKLFWNTDTANAVAGWGPDGTATNANEGAAIVFTAPVTGTYNITGHFNKTYVKNSAGKHYCDYKIILENGTVVFDGTNYDESTLEEFNDLSHTLGGSVELNKGEKVYIVKSPNASATVGSQGGTLYSLTVAQIGDVCEGNHTIVDGVCTVCDYECANHAWKNADGVCTICGFGHGHDVTANDATCTAAAICGTCGYEVAGINENAHAPATEWTTDETSHWHVCENGCNEQLAFGLHNYATGTCVCGIPCPHDWNNKDGICAFCDTPCPTHDMKNEDGTCTTCGMTHEHDWMDGVCKTCGYECQHTGGTATCATRAICEDCDSYYGDTVANNHEREGKWVDDVDGCYLYYGCCYTSEPVQDHVYDDDADMTCNHCGHDRTVAVKEEDFAGVFEDVFGEGESDVVAEAPEENAFDNYAAVAGSKADVYLGFNLELVGADADYVYLRHHILYNGGEVLVDGNEVTLNNVSGNYYYFDVAVAIGDFDKAHVVTIDGDTIVTASVYSYMKTAYGSGTLNAEQTNLLNALYQWDKAVADATYNG